MREANILRQNEETMISVVPTLLLRSRSVSAVRRRGFSIAPSPEGFRNRRRVSCGTLDNRQLVTRKRRKNMIN